MGNPLGDATNALGEIINNVQTLRKEVEIDIVQPLQSLPGVDINGLDTTHDTCVKAVQTALGKLYAPGVNFSGSGADAISQLMEDYFTQESKLNNYTSDTISEYMLQLEQLCKSTINDLQPHLDALQGIMGPNVLISDAINYWSDVFHKGPQELLLGLQVGPWKLGDFLPANQLMAQQGSVMGPQQFSPTQIGQELGNALEQSFWDMVAEVLAPLAVVVLVVNLVTEAIKQGKLDWDMGNIGWFVMRWLQQMGDLHNQILSQNTGSSLPARAQSTLFKATNSDIIVLSASVVKPVMKSWQKTGYQELIAFCTDSHGNLDHKKLANTNYGGGYIQLYDKNGNLVKINGQMGLQTPTFFSPDGKKGHVEEQTVQWTIDWLNAYNKAHPGAPITSIVLSIFTYKAPCGPAQKNCASNLSKSNGQKSQWEQDIYSKTNPHVDATIDVWTANNNNNPKAVKPWP